MKWRLSPFVDLSSERVDPEDGKRQMKTAREILRRFDDRPGVVLADEVGMGKTFVALAVAASVVEATRGWRPVIVMVPSAVAEKWPREWEVFRSLCLKPGGFEIRAEAESIRNGAEFLKLLDDPPDRRSHIIFLTHGALTSTLGDPIVRMAIVRRVFASHRSLAPYRNAFIRHAQSIMRGRGWWANQDLVRRLLESDPRRWRYVFPDTWNIDDDPVPAPLIDAMKRVDLSTLAAALRRLPLRTRSRAEERLADVRQEIDGLFQQVWSECMARLDLELPLLILDEAHHTRNPNTRLASLFSNPEAERDADALAGPLADVFDRMLFLTATPFQLAHSELIEVLRRFESVRWSDASALEAYRKEISDLERSLDAAQGQAIQLDDLWSRLRPEDVENLPESWLLDGLSDLPSRAALIRVRFNELMRRNREVERRLRRFVIRHARGPRSERREVLAGAGIINGRAGGGLRASGESVLPFLLAARTQAAVVSHSRRTGIAERAFFAEGLSSSFEAYRMTRQAGADALEVDGTRALTRDDGAHAWYLDELDRALPRGRGAAWGAHPKISATVERCVDLWERGDKVLVFCFYIATGRALRRHISIAVGQKILDMAATSLRLAASDRDAVTNELRLIRERFSDQESPLRSDARERVRRRLVRQGLEGVDLDRAVEVTVSFLGTPSFLVRYFDLRALRERRYKDALTRALAGKDGSGMKLGDRIREFGEFLRTRQPGEREELIATLEETDTRTIWGESAAFDPSEAVRRREDRLPNVRLANGGVERETRRRLMLSFNTPFFPEILIASSVMAEGVDLHLNCRHVIHHDLDWNPSVLEQRTGRVDRLGSLATRSKQKIAVYEPYVEGTQDEKLYRVVKDRERWFNVVMGERLSLDERATDTIAERLEFPSSAADALTIDLSVA